MRHQPNRISYGWKFFQNTADTGFTISIGNMCNSKAAPFYYHSPSNGMIITAKMKNLIGNFSVTALQLISVGDKSKYLGFLVGFLGIVTVTFILSFYAVVSGWMFALFVEPVARFFGWISIADWLEFDSTERNVIALVLFMILTISIINAGVQDGIEKWARIQSELSKVNLFWWRFQKKKTQ